MKKRAIFAICSMFSLALILWASHAAAYDSYSTTRTAGNCADCHGGFRATGGYVPLKGGPAWSGNLHDAHRNTMLSGDCNTCHLSTRFPTFLDRANGGNGFSGLGCVGCHGRSQDTGPGAGLRQHHTNAGEISCLDCHSDADPTQYTPVGENVAPPFYFTPDASHAAKPTSPCNLNSEEDITGSTLGLDNDGDGFYDGDDTDCVAAPAPVADINLNPAALDFGASFTGQSAVRSMQIENLGTANLNVSAIGLCAGTSAEFTWTPNAPFVVAAGGTATLTVTYTPNGLGADTGCLAISSDDPDEATVNLNLSGTGEAVPVPDINLNPAALDFGTAVVGTSSTQTVQIQNLGTAALTVSAVNAGTATSAEFAFAFNGPVTVAAGASQTLSVTYTPVDGGQDAGSLAISSDDPDEPEVVLSLTGNGTVPTSPAVTLNPAAIDFGALVIGESIPLSIQIDNTGTADLTVSAIGLCAGTTTEFTWTPAAPFTVAPGAGQTVTVTYTPTGAGADAGCLSIASDDPVRPSVELALSGSASALPVPDINLTPAFLEFAPTVVGNTTTLTFQVENMGTADLTVSSVSLGAATSAEFTVSPAGPFTVASLTSETVTVTYTPGDVGQDLGSLVIASDDPDEAEVSLSLTGTGAATPVADIDLNPASLSFGSTVIGNATVLTAQIQNLGTADLTVSAVNLCAGTSGELSATLDAPVTLAPGASHSLRVTYTPADEGQDTGCLTIASDDPDEPEVTLSLSGTGILAPTEVVDLDISEFNADNRAQLPRPNVVKIKLKVRNAGDFNAPRQATVVGVQNGTEVFSETKMVSARVRKSAEYRFGPFTPTAAGDIKWTVTISDDDPDADTATAVTQVRNQPRNNDHDDDDDDDHGRSDRGRNSRNR